MIPALLCQQCQNTIPHNAPQGLCPICLIRDGVKRSNFAESSQFGRGGYTPLSPEAVNEKFEHLEVVEFIGQGAMGAVYKARQMDLNRWVAVKVLAPVFSDDASFAERFIREGKTLARLDHPHIVKVYEAGESEGFYFIVMEHVEGSNLKSLIRSGELQAEDAFSFVPQLCEAVQYAHDNGVIHRDIKPENILVDELGQIKVADFGLAKLTRSKDQLVSITGTGQVLGTPLYMAPEQIEKPNTVDHRADIYGLGVVFYEILTGELPLGRFPLPSEKVEVHVRIDDIVLTALQKDPERRYQRAIEIKESLEKLPENEPGPAQVKVAEKTRKRTLSSQAKLCKTSLLGILWSCCGPLAIIPLLMLNTQAPQGMGEEMTHSQSFVFMQVFSLVIGFLAITAPIAGPLLGLSGIKRIFKSDGQLYGMLLAVLATLFYPLLILDGLLIAVTNAFIPLSSSPVNLIWLAIIPITNIRLVAMALKSARKSGLRAIKPFMIAYCVLVLMAAISLVLVMGFRSDSPVRPSATGFRSNSKQVRPVDKRIERGPELDLTDEDLDAKPIKRKKRR
jgi:serine/threonine protein kinase